MNKARRAGAFSDFAAARSVAGFRGVFLNHFRVYVDRNVVADNYAAVIHGGVPLHAKILAVDFRGGIDRDTLVAPGIFDWRGGAIDVKSDFLGHAMDGQITGDLQLAGADLLHLLRL